MHSVTVRKVYSCPVQNLTVLDELKRCRVLIDRAETRLAELRLRERQIAARAHRRGHSFATIADALGVSRTRAQQLVEEGRGVTDESQ